MTVHFGIAGLQRGLAHPEPLLSVVEGADRLGFDSVWFNEQHFAVGVRGAPSSLLLAAAALARTTRIRVGLSVVVVPAYHPVMLAEMLAQLDELGGGRLDVGIGRGSSPGLNQAIPDQERKAAFQEGYRILREAWQADSVSADGPIWRFQNVPISLRPACQLPLFIAGTSRDTMTLVVRDGLRLLLSLEPPEGRQLALLEDVRREHGVITPRRVSFSRYVCIAPSAGEATDRARDLWRRIQWERRIIAEQRGQAFADRPFDQFCQEQVIAGDADGCIRAIDALVQDHELDHLRCVFNGNGALSAEETLDQMQQFSATVLRNRDRLWPGNATGGRATHQEEG